jgi:hypothetical protein
LLPSFYHQGERNLKKSLVIFSIVALVVFVFFAPETALAGPGGKIIEVATRTFLGKVIIGVLVIIFLPVILYIYSREALAQRRTLNDLKNLRQLDKNFDWFRLKERVTECFHKVHSAWRAEDMEKATQWMTSWYWQNQQIAYLEQWKNDGLVNHCRVKSIKKIRPLFLSVDNDGNIEEARLVVAISAVMEDYLAERETGKIVEGQKGFHDMETVWTFVGENNQWVVSNIEEDVMSLFYAKLKNQLPAYSTAQKTKTA